MLSFFVSCCCCKIEIIKKPRGGICMRKPRHGNVWETRSASPKPMAALPPRQPSGRKTHTRDIPKQQPSLARALSFIFFFFLSFFLFPLPFSHLGFFFFLFFWGKYIWRVLFLFFFFLPCYLITLPHFSMNLHIFNQNWIFFFFCNCVVVVRSRGKWRRWRRCGFWLLGALWNESRSRFAVSHGQNVFNEAIKPVNGVCN